MASFQIRPGFEAYQSSFEWSPQAYSFNVQPELTAAGGTFTTFDWDLIPSLRQNPILIEVSGPGAPVGPPGDLTGRAIAGELVIA